MTLLVDPNKCVEADDTDYKDDLDDGSKAVLACCDDGLEHRHGGDSDEDVDKHVIDLVPDALPDRHLHLLRHLVGPVLHEARRSFASAQA